MTEPGTYQLGEKIGQLAEKINGLVDALAESKGIQERRHEDGLRNHRENIGRFIRLEEGVKDTQRSVSELQDDFKEIKKPVDDMIALRLKFGAWIGVLAAIFGAVWFFVSGPMKDFFAQMFLLGMHK